MKKNHKSNRTLQLVAIITLAIFAGILIGWWVGQNKSTEQPDSTVQQSQIPSPDATKFRAEYSSASPDNPFVYKTPTEIVEILEKGTGLIYMGFPECPWCQKYVGYLDEVATSEGLKEIYYLNIREIRKNNTPEYQRIVELTQKHLDKDDSGQPRVFVPDVVAVNDGEILGHNNTSSLNTSADGTPNDWWTNERIGQLKTELTHLVKEVQRCLSVCRE